MMIEASVATVLAASVVAIASTTTAIYASIKTARNSKHLAQLQSELAKQKDMTLEYIRTYLSLEIGERQQTFTAFKEFIRLVQLLREKIRRVVSYPDAYAPDLIGKDFVDLCTNIAECYAMNQVHFDDVGPESDRAIAHSLKNECGAAADIVQKYVAGREDDQLRKLDLLQASIAAKQADLMKRARSYTNVLVDEIKYRIEEGNKNEGNSKSQSPRTESHIPRSSKVLAP